MPKYPDVEELSKTVLTIHKELWAPHPIRPQLSNAEARTIASKWRQTLIARVTDRGMRQMSAGKIPREGTSPEGHYQALIMKKLEMLGESHKDPKAKARFDRFLTTIYGHPRNLSALEESSAETDFLIPGKGEIRKKIELIGEAMVFCFSDHREMQRLEKRFAIPKRPQLEVR